jgi:ABC-type polar amino acid transport system ATPase subunit
MAKSILDIRELGMEFDGKSLFENVDLQAQAGEIIAISGNSGVGKTTLLRLIAGTLKPTRGVIFVDEKPVVFTVDLKINTSTVIVTQQPNLWDHLTVIDNIALVRRLLHEENRKAAKSWAMGALKKLQMEYTFDRYPHSLSGGEQQRVALIRGFATERPLLLLDEITSNIDRERKRVIAKALVELSEERRTIIFVTHDLTTASLVTKKTLELTPQGLIPVTIWE